MMSGESTKIGPTFLENIPSQVGGLSAVASANAPIIYADGVPVYGSRPGIITATLTATRQLIGGNDHVVVAHLRLPKDIAQLLADSLLKAIAMTEKPEGAAN